MSIAHLLEDFSPLTRGNTVSLTDVSLEEQRLEAFEKGYKEGWEDALKSLADSDAHVATSLGQNLEDLSFTYQEAYVQVMQAIRPLMDQILGSVLPEIARETLGLQIMEQIESATKSNNGAPFEIVVSPDDLPGIETVLSQQGGVPASLRAEDTMGPGQVRICLPDNEREIDIPAVISEMKQAINDYFEQPRKDTAHG